MVWDVSLGLPPVISDTTYVYIYGNGPIGMVDTQGSAYYFLRDGLGSVTSIVDASGTLTSTYSCDAYGNLQSSTGTLPNAVRYTGEWYDGETGFYYLRARYYDRAAADSPAGTRSRVS